VQAPEWVSYVLLCIAGIALVFAVGFAVRPSSTQDPPQPARWHVIQACCAALAATLAALCVLVALL
jgi:hypothetical protein